MQGMMAGMSLQSVHLKRNGWEWLRAVQSLPLWQAYFHSMPTLVGVVDVRACFLSAPVPVRVADVRESVLGYPFFYGIGACLISWHNFWGSFVRNMLLVLS